MDREGRAFFLSRSHRENLVRAPFDLPGRSGRNDPAEPPLDLEVKGIAQGQGQLLDLPGQGLSLGGQNINVEKYSYFINFFYNKNRLFVHKHAKLYLFWKNEVFFSKKLHANGSNLIKILKRLQGQLPP